MKDRHFVLGLAGPETQQAEIAQHVSVYTGPGS